MQAEPGPAVRGLHPLVWELVAVTVLAWFAFLAIPLTQGGMGVSWDALNHHIYLGWTADRNRLDQDFLAAGYQSFTYPYLYWPVYKLAASGVSGLVAGLVLATLPVLVVPAVWIIALQGIPGVGAVETTMRLAAVALAFLSGVVLSLFDSTSNDLLAAIPFVWSLALALHALATKPESWMTARRAVVLSGLLAGVAVGFKLSNATLAMLLPVFWVFVGSNGRVRVLNAVLGCLATLAGFLVAYGYWGWQLWSRYGNPVYPFYDAAFQPLRHALGWLP